MVSGVRNSLLRSTYVMLTNLLKAHGEMRVCCLVLCHHHVTQSFFSVMVEQWLRPYALASKLAGSLPPFRIYDKRLCTPHNDTDKNEFRSQASKTSAVISDIQTIHTHHTIVCLRIFLEINKKNCLICEIRYCLI